MENKIWLMVGILISISSILVFTPFIFRKDIDVLLLSLTERVTEIVQMVVLF